MVDYLLAWDGHNGNEELDKSIYLPLKRIVRDNNSAMQWVFNYHLVLPLESFTYEPYSPVGLIRYRPSYPRLGDKICPRIEFRFPLSCFLGDQL